MILRIRLSRLNLVGIGFIFIGKWKVLQSDLIPLLLTQPQDKKLSFYIVINLVQLTDFPDESAAQKEFLFSCLQEYKLAFLQNDVMKTLMVHMADCIEVPLENKSKIHDQMIELIVTLLRNLVQIPDNQSNQNFISENKRNMQFNLLEVFARDNVLDALVYLCQDFSNDFIKKLNLVLLEIFYHIFGCFKPSWIFSIENEKNILEELQQKEKQIKMKRMSQLATRHSRFETQLKVKKNLDGTLKIVNRINDNDNQINYLVNQMHKPQTRKQIQKYEPIFKKELSLDNYGVLNNKLFRECVKMFASDFFENAFNPLIESVYHEIYRDSDRLQTNDKIYYFYLLSFGISLCRYKYYYDKFLQEKVKKPNFSEIEESTKAELELNYIVNGIQITQFELVYSTMLREVTKTKKTMFDFRLYHSTINCLLEMLALVKDMSLSFSSINRKNSSVLQQNIFRHDLTRCFRIGFYYCFPGLFNNLLLKDLIETVSLYFDLLETYSKGKVLSLKTEKILKRKIKKAKKKKKDEMEDDDLKDFIEKDKNDEEDDVEYNPDGNMPEKEDKNIEKDSVKSIRTDSESENDENEPIFQERKFNLISELAILADYEVITKIFRLISGDNFLRNTKETNNSIYRFIKRIVEYLEADWIFYQIDYLIVFNEILYNEEIKVFD